ncbi:hypothetical protein BDV95DRAFT_562951 [Massariosphaeria phaeospora]|uniref:Uncharacterized protein n=1 Tax=Massariosphaeria phaeospora TaxID=100035 RepID=A0A7C8ILY7_9PLEO|nr:hypothetical protein BDV95DRAFT_562951 [Massariosphaeria phaeospora]
MVIVLLLTVRFWWGDSLDGVTRSMVDHVICKRSKILRVTAIVLETDWRRADGLYGSSRRRSVNKSYGLMRDCRVSNIDGSRKYMEPCRPLNESRVRTPIHCGRRRMTNLFEIVRGH